MREFPQGEEPVPGLEENVDMEDAEVSPASPPTERFRDRSAMTPRKRRVTCSENEKVEVQGQTRNWLETSW